MNKIILMLFSITFGLFTYAFSETYHNVTPYVGSISNVIISPNGGFKIKDSDILKGIYYQQIDPSSYQFNIFLYNSDDINNSDLQGVHFISDWYFKENETGKYVAGLGLDVIDLDSDIIEVTPSVSLDVSHTIYAPYLRFGHYYYYKNNKITFTLFPWLGLEADIVSGEVVTNISSRYPGQPSMLHETDIDHTYEYALVGMQFKVSYHHFLSLKLKYHRKVALDTKGFNLDNASAMLNVSLSKNWGVSYRYKDLEEISAEISYHIFGFSYVFK